MKKDKASKAAKKKTAKKAATGGAGKTLRKLGKGFGGLSTTQLVAGGAALTALGLSYLATRRARTASLAATTEPAATPPDAAGAEQNLATMTGGGI